uniref:Uncharacterized protein n=1 Tax=Globodera pallida TaxID=36090 RepID=A0A183CJ60_GLOPA
MAAIALLRAGVQSVLLLITLAAVVQRVHGQWVPQQQQQQTPQRPLLTSDPLTYGAQRINLGCVVCMNCCCFCTPARPPIPPEQPPLVPSYNQPGGASPAQQQMPLRHSSVPSPYEDGQHFPVQQSAQAGAFGVPFVGSPTAGYSNPAAGPVQFAQQRQQMASGGGGGTLSELPSGEPGFLPNYRGDQYTNAQRSFETREMNGPFFERIGGEPRYSGGDSDRRD